MKKKDKTKNIIFGIIAIVIQVILSYIFVINYELDELIILCISVIFSIVLLCFKKTRKGAIVGIVISVLLYYIIQPISSRISVQQTCNTYGEGFKAVKDTDKITIEALNNPINAHYKYYPEEYRWYCLSPDGQLIGVREIYDYRNRRKNKNICNN